MAEAVKNAVESAKEGIKQLAVSDKPRQQQGQKKEKKSKASGSSGPEELSPPAKYIEERLALFDSLKGAYDEFIAAKPREDITVTLPDGKTLIGKSYETSPADIAKGIAKSLFDRVFIRYVSSYPSNSIHLIVH